MTTEVRATGRSSFRHAGEAVLDTGTVVDHSKQTGTADSGRERFNIVENPGASWLAQVFSTQNIPSGPAALLVFTLIRTLLTLCSSLAMELTSAMVPLTVWLLASNRAFIEDIF